MQVDQLGVAHLSQYREIGRQLGMRHVIQPDPLLNAGFQAIRIVERLTDELAAQVV
ncbi:hypothetical protein [Pseudomonas sp. NPDC089734]|uniref:hypothetical protein n=1 Tax=Pseudomonas sp. NPDC089734 TaxID=3364469 RepID=UPI00382F08F0